MTNGTTSGFTSPNWYYYYNQVYHPTGFDYSYSGALADTFGGICIGNDWDFDPSQPDGYKINSTTITIGPNAINIPSIPVFALREENDGKKHIHYIGDLYIYGIHRYIRVLAEEIAHAELFQSHTVLPFPKSDGTRPAVVDTDGDLVPDSVEDEVGLNKMVPNSTGAFQAYAEAGYGGFEDAEVLANILALGILVQNEDASQQDWADTGLQYGARPPYFPWRFHPLWFEFDNGTPDMPDSDHLPLDASGNPDYLTSLPNVNQ